MFKTNLCPSIRYDAKTHQIPLQDERRINVSKLGLGIPAPLTPPALLSFPYQPETQFFFVLADRLNLVNLYSIPTEMAKFTSNWEKVEVAYGGASRKV